ncbi:MAG: BMP family ABC transporter substrate-binding protein [Oscillospiraceae bacterium]|nr:BMP family ABC transporter substrate-binding protein [Oscillospiraceae bacterium]
MKKIISLFLVLVLMLALFVGCKDNDTPTEAKPGETGTAQKSDLKLALVVAGQFGDRSFYDSSKDGVDRLAKDLGIQVTKIECNNDGHDAQMKNAADKADVVVCVGWEFYNIEEIAPQYPNVKWIWIDNATSQPISNVLNITYAQNEGSFLAGYIAAAMSKSGVIGAVGGEDQDVINDFIVGYKQGAAAYDANIKVVTNYADTYDDPAKGKECAFALNDQKADVIFQIASATGDGVFEAAKERGFYAIGVDSDQKYINPDVIICSMKKEVGNSIYDAVKALVDGDASRWGTTWVADMSTGYVGIGYGDDTMTQQVPDEVKTAVEEMAKKIISGEIKVDTTR